MLTHHHHSAHIFIIQTGRFHPSRTAKMLIAINFVCKILFNNWMIISLNVHLIDWIRFFPHSFLIFGYSIVSMTVCDDDLPINARVNDKVACKLHLSITYQTDAKVVVCKYLLLLLFILLIACDTCMKKPPLHVATINIAEIDTEKQHGHRMFC